MPHRIRLGPPWEVTSAADRTRHARKFGRPRTLDQGERVWLICATVSAPAEVFLNGLPIGTVAEAGSSFATDITELLQPRNEVIFELAGDDSVEDVALEIRAL
jgi:hypothetical protein